MTDYAKLASQLGKVRRRWKRTAALSGLAILLIEAAILLSVLLVLDLVYRPEFTVRLVAGVAAAAVLALLALRHVVAPLTRRIPDQQLALYVEEHDEHFEGALMTAAEFARVSGLPPEQAGMVQAVIDAAELRTETDDPRHVVEVGKLKRYGAVAVVLVAAYAALFVASPAVQDQVTRVVTPWQETNIDVRLAQAGKPKDAAIAPAELGPIDVTLEPTGEVRVGRGRSTEFKIRLSRPSEAPVVLNFRAVADPQGRFRQLRAEKIEEVDSYAIRLDDLNEDLDIYASTGPYESGRQRVTVYDPIALEGFEVTTVFPDYLQTPQRVVQQPTGSVDAPVGSKVTVKLLTNRPIKSGTVTWADGKQQEMAADSERNTAAVAAFDVTVDGSYTWTVVDVDGQKLSSSAPSVVHAIKDNPPVVTLKYPTNMLTVHPLGEVAFVAEASDDFGLASVDMVYQSTMSPDAAEKRVPLGLAQQAAGPLGVAVPTPATLRLALEDLSPRLVPGDLVTYWVEARDRNPRNDKSITNVQFLAVANYETWAVIAIDPSGPPMPQIPPGEKKDLQELIRQVFELWQKRPNLAEEDFRKQTSEIAQGMIDPATGAVAQYVSLPQKITPTPERLAHIEKGQAYVVQGHEQLKAYDVRRAMNLFIMAMSEQTLAAMEDTATAGVKDGPPPAGAAPAAAAAAAAAMASRLAVEANITSKIDEPGKQGQANTPEGAAEDAAKLKKAQDDLVAQAKKDDPKSDDKGNKAAPDKAGAQKAGADKTGGEKAGGEKAGGEKAGGQKAGGQKAGGQKAGGDKAGGDKAGGDKAGGDKAGGDKAGGDKAGGDKAGGDKAGGDKAGGDKAGGDKAGGDKAGGDKAGGDKAGGDKAGGDKAGGDKAGGNKSGMKSTPQNLAGQQREVAGKASEMASTLKRSGNAKVREAGNTMDKAAAKMHEAAADFDAGKQGEGTAKAQEASELLGVAQENLSKESASAVENALGELERAFKRLLTRQREVRVGTEETSASRDAAVRDRDFKRHGATQTQIKADLAELAKVLDKLDQMAAEHARRDTSKWITDAKRDLIRGKTDQHMTNAIVELAANRGAEAVAEEKAAEDALVKVLDDLKEALKTLPVDAKKALERAIEDANAAKTGLAKLGAKPADTKAGGDKAGGDKAGGDKAGGDKAGGDKAGGDKAGGDKAGGDKAGGDKAGGDKAGGDKAGGDKAGGDKAGGDKAGGDKAGGDKAGGDKAGGDKAGGDKAGGDKAGGDKAGGDKAGGDKAGGDKAGGDKAGGDKAGGDKAGGDKAGGDKAGGDKAGGDKAGGDKAGGDKAGGDKAGGDKAGGDKAGGDKAGGDKAGGDKAGGDKAGGDKAGGDKAGGDKAGGDKAGGDKAGGDKQGDNQSGSGNKGDIASTRGGATGAQRREIAAATAERLRQLGERLTDRQTSADARDVAAIVAASADADRLRDELTNEPAKLDEMMSLVDRVSRKLVGELESKISADKLNAAAREECPPAYRELVNKYYEALSQIKQ
jgi:hypothetical protein